DWGMATPAIPDSLGGMPDLSIVVQVDLFGAFANIGIIATTLLVFALLLANFFDAMGTFTALGKASGLADQNGVLPRLNKALLVEAFGAVAGGLGALSFSTVFADSSAGVCDVARPGLAIISTGVLFLAAMLLPPLYAVVPIEAASPRLVIVGVMMA